MQIEIIELDARDEDDVAQTVALTTGARFNPSDVPRYFYPSVVELSPYTREIFDNGELTGSTRISASRLTASNVDDTFTPFDGWVFAGEDFRLYTVDSNGTYASRVLVSKGKIAAHRFDLEFATWDFRDRQFELTDPFLENRWGGTNAPPNGVDGIAELKDALKNKAYGYVYNATVQNANPSKAIYSLHDGLMGGNAVMYIGAVPVPAAVQRANTTALQTTAPANGYFDYVNNATGSFGRLGTDPLNYPVTADIIGDARGGVFRTKLGDIFREILQVKGYTDADVSVTDITALNVVAPGPIGVYINDNRGTDKLLDGIMPSAAAFWGPDRLNVFRVRRLVAPAGTPVYTFKQFGTRTPGGATDGDILEFTPLAAEQPVFQVTVQYLANETVQSGTDIDDVMSSTTAGLARSEFVKQPFRQTTKTDSTVKARNKFARSITVPTRLTAKADADALAQYLLDLLSPDQQRWKLVASLGPDTGTALDLGEVVKVQFDRVGFSDGVLFLTTAHSLDMIARTITLSLWGYKEYG